MFERFSDCARKVMAMANQEAITFGHQYIGTEHLLLALVKEGDGAGANVIKNCDVELRKVRLEVEKLMKSGPDISVAGKLPQTPSVKKVIEFAIMEMRDLHHDYVGTEHLLLGLLKGNQGVAHTVFSIVGLSFDRARTGVIELWAMGWKDDSTAKTADPRIAALARLLPGHSPGNPQPNGGVFDIQAVESGVVIIHRIATQIEVTSADLANGAQSQAAKVMRLAAEQLEKKAAELRESAGRLKHE